MKKEDLESWVLAAIKAHGGEAEIVPIAKHIWTDHESELRKSEEIFFTWQYQMRWAAQNLQRAGKLKKTKVRGKAVWVLLPKAA